MKILLDTHCWLWYLLSPERLNRSAQDILRDPNNDVFLSVGSSWEIVIKTGLGKLSLPLPATEYIPDRLKALGHQSLPVFQHHVLQVAHLPAHHRDPFDRLLVAQAQAEELHLMTADPLLQAYDVPIFWAG